MLSLLATSASGVAAAAASSAATDLLTRFPSAPPLVEPTHSAVVTSTTSDTIATTRLDTRMMAIVKIVPKIFLYGGEEPYARACTM